MKANNNQIIDLADDCTLSVYATDYKETNKYVLVRILIKLHFSIGLRKRTEHIEHISARCIELSDSLSDLLFCTNLAEVNKSRSAPASCLLRSSHNLFPTSPYHERKQRLMRRDS